MSLIDPSKRLPASGGPVRLWWNSHKNQVFVGALGHIPTTEMPRKEEKSDNYAKMSKQSHVVVVRQQHRFFIIAILSHYKPLFRPKRGFLV